MKQPQNRPNGAADLCITERGGSGIWPSPVDSLGMSWSGSAWSRSHPCCSLAVLLHSPESRSGPFVAVSNIVHHLRAPVRPWPWAPAVQFLVTNKTWLVVSTLLKNYEFVSYDIPNIWKVIKAMFQTINQRLKSGSPVHQISGEISADKKDLVISAGSPRRPCPLPS